MLIVEFKRYFRARSLEWQGVGLLTGWGVILLMQGATFDQPSYRTLAYIASEDRWGLLTVGIGMLRAAALVINGMWRPCAHLRAGFSAVTAILWLEVALGLLLAGTSSTGMAVYVVLSCFEAYAATQAMSDAASMDRRAADRRIQDEARRARSRERANAGGG